MVCYFCGVVFSTSTDVLRTDAATFLTLKLRVMQTNFDRLARLIVIKIFYRCPVILVSLSDDETELL